MFLTQRGLIAIFVLAMVGFTAADVEVKTWFPDSPNLEFVLNSHITSVIGIRNNGPEGFNVTAVQGNLALVSDPAGNVFNFSGMGYQYPQLMEGDEIVLQYFMPLAPGIPARKFFLNLNIFSQGEEVTMKQAFNQTIEFIEESKIVDFELLGLYAIFYGILFAICYALYNYAVAQGWIKKSKPAKKTQVKADRKEWLKGTIADKKK